MDTRIEVNEADDYVDGDAIISKHDHYFFKKVMKQRVISFRMQDRSGGPAKLEAGKEVDTIVDLTSELIHVLLYLLNSCS
jgi:hypothetical protein